MRSGVEWKYLLNVAGLSFPLKSNEEIVNILRIYNGNNDVEGIYGRRILKGRFQNEWIENATTVSCKKRVCSIRFAKQLLVFSETWSS